VVSKYELVELMLYNLYEVYMRLGHTSIIARKATAPIVASEILEVAFKRALIRWIASILWMML